MTKADSMSPRTPPTPKPVSAPKTAARTAPRFRSRRDWLSNEPGAWAIVLMPTLSALFACGPTVTTCWLAVAWACCYCVQFSAARWFKSRFRTRYVRPALTYLGALGAIGMPFVVLHPGVLRWAPLYIALAAGSMLGAWMRREHSLWANACAVLASSAMPLVMQPYGAHATPAMQLNGDTLPSVHSWFPEGTFAQPALMLSLAYTAMLGGSVLFVKTMIRERGKWTYLTASWIWHAVICTAGFAASPWLGAAGALLLARAVAMPLVARVRRVPAKTTGITESIASLLCFVLIICAVI